MYAHCAFPVRLASLFIPHHPASSYRISAVDFLYKAAGRRAPGFSKGPRSERYATNHDRWDKIEAQTVGDAMSTTPLTVSPDTSMQDAAAMLLEKKIGRLLVVDDDEQLVGLLSCTDMMDLILSGDFAFE